MKVTWYKKFVKAYKEFIIFESETNNKFNVDYSLKNFVDYLERFYQED